jgi:hypothetical protein
MSTDKPAKYITENGVMKLNPAYAKSQGTSIADPKKALAAVSSVDEVMAVNESRPPSNQVKLSESTNCSIEIMQDGDFNKKFKSPRELESGQAVDNLGKFFAEYEVPIGLINKLLILSEYNLNNIIDDSGSMNGTTDSDSSTLGSYMKQKMGVKNEKIQLNRWQEAENRIHCHLDILSYIPTQKITFRFLNRSDVIVLDRDKNKTPEEFTRDAHEKISQAFKKLPDGVTPIYSRLKKSLSESSGKTMHYVFSDGEPTPSDGTIQDVIDLVKNRKDPQNNPITMLSCTDNDKEVEWFKLLDEVGPWTSELDDFEDEKREVLAKQGPALPFSKGLWLICALVAAISPFDLDNIDEGVPFTKNTLDNILGRVLTDVEYKHYWDNNPNSHKYQNIYSYMIKEQDFVQNIIKKYGGCPPAYN